MNIFLNEDLSGYEYRLLFPISVTIRCYFSLLYHPCKIV